MVSPLFRISILPGNSILVESEGYTSEIFKPYIQNGKINVFNLIPCKDKPALKVAFRPRKVLGDISNHHSKTIRVLQDISLKTLLTTQCIANQENTRPSSQTSPQIVAPSVQIVPTATKNSTPKTTTPRLGHNVKVIKLHRKPTENANQNLGKVVSPKICAVPVYSKQAHRRVRTPGTVTKWRKCITPQRTYSKLGGKILFATDSPGILRRHSLIVYRNNYKRRANTQGCYGEELIRFQKVQTIIDPKTKISPRRFKQQLHEWSDITKTDAEEVAPKTKIEYLNALGRAFHLLTHASRSRCYSEKLSRMFRKRCSQKYSRTDRSFLRFVEPLPPLETTGNSNFRQPVFCE